MQPQPMDGSQASLAAFGDIFHSDGARQIASRAIEWAMVDAAANEIVVDVRAMVQVTIARGLAGGDNAAVWLTEAMAAQRLDPAGYLVTRHKPQEIERALAAGMSVVLSSSMRRKIVPLAQRMAQETVARQRIDLRHLVAAIFAPSSGEWTSANAAIKPVDLPSLRAHLYARIAQAPEPDEQLDAWRRQLAIDGDPSGTPQASPPPAATGERPPRGADDALPVHTDDPATIDQLGREGFARVLAARVIQARKRAAADAEASARDEDDNRAFIVHIHGPWGSGKSTLLNFMRRELEKMEPCWLVVEFNAWRSQRLKPPWWSVITQVKRAAIRDRPGFASRAALRLRWRLLRAQADLVPAAIGAALVATALLLGVATSFGPGQPLQWLTTAITGLVGVFAFSRSLVFGSASVAQSFAELRSDPYGPMITLFARLVRAVDKPIVMFIDDLDRCDSAYVCDLLENIQTMLRAAPITYVIAADRRWICTSFEKRYTDFAEVDVDSGRPLGYQFLDKLFQISATVPIISATTQTAFWNGLLSRAPPGDAAASPEAVAKEARTITAAASVEECERLIADRADKPALQQALRAELAMKLSSPSEEKATEHRLRPLAALIDGNPRAMKRLANAVGMNQARLALEARQDIALEAIARWTIVELRWPLLADWLSADPARVAAAPSGEGVVNDQAMRALLARCDVANVIGGAEAAGRLDEGTLRTLVG